MIPSRPKISVLVPAYQYARFLPEAIESVLSQDFSDFELLISDDASTDDSAEIARAFAARDRRIRVHIHPTNIGMVENWNWCLREARADLVKYVFADDCLPSPRALGKMASMLDREPRAVLACTARSIIDAESRQTGVWDKIGAAGYHPGKEIVIRCMRHDRNLIGEPSAVMFRRSAAERGFDPAFRQLVDLEMWYHLLTNGGLVYDPEPLCAFRRHPVQQTVANQREQIASAETLRIAARYFDTFACALGDEPRSTLPTRSTLRPETTRSFALRRRLFRQIYYSRKDGLRTPLDAAAADFLLTKLTRRWYFALWVLHRATKPWVNFARFRLGRRQGAADPDPAVR